MGELMREEDIDSRGPYWTLNGRLKYKSNVKAVSSLFEAILDDGKEIIVKYVRHHYGEDVHKYLADAEFAPKLIECRSLPGGWHAMVMEKLNGDSTFTFAVSDSVKQHSLREAVDRMHSNNYIPGVCTR